MKIAYFLCRLLKLFNIGAYMIHKKDAQNVITGFLKSLERHLLTASAIAAAGAPRLLFGNSRLTNEIGNGPGLSFGLPKATPFVNFALCPAIVAHLFSGSFSIGLAGYRRPVPFFISIATSCLMVLTSMIGAACLS